MRLVRFACACLLATLPGIGCRTPPQNIPRSTFVSTPTPGIQRSEAEVAKAAAPPRSGASHFKTISHEELPSGAAPSKVVTDSSTLPAGELSLDWLVSEVEAVNPS